MGDPLILFRFSERFPPTEERIVVEVDSLQRDALTGGAKVPGHPDIPLYQFREKKPMLFLFLAIVIERVPREEDR